MSDMMWNIPVTQAISTAERRRDQLLDQMGMHGDKPIQTLDNTSMNSNLYQPDDICEHGDLIENPVSDLRSTDSVLIQSAVFDVDRCVACSVEAGNMLVHGSGGRGYGLGSTVMTSGCYQWKVS